MEQVKTRGRASPGCLVHSSQPVTPSRNISESLRSGKRRASRETSHTTFSQPARRQRRTQRCFQREGLSAEAPAGNAPERVKVPVTLPLETATDLIAQERAEKIADAVFARV